MMIISSDISHIFVHCLLNELLLFRSLLVLSWIFDDKRFLQFVFIMICFSTSRCSVSNHRLLFDELRKNESFDLIISSDLYVTLVVWLLNDEIKIELLVIHQKIVEHDMSKFEFVLIDVERRRFRAARLVELSQSHHEITENKVKNESSILRAKNLASVRDQIQSCWSLLIFNKIALQLFSHENLSSIEDWYIDLLVISFIVSLALFMICCNINVHLSFSSEFVKIDFRPLIYSSTMCRMQVTFINSDHEARHKTLKSLQYKFLLDTRRSLRSIEAVYVEWCIFFLTCIEHLLCQLIKSRDLLEDDVNEIRNIELKTWKKFFFQCVIDLISVLKCVCEIARVEESRNLLKQWCKWWLKWERNCRLQYKFCACDEIEYSCSYLCIFCLCENKLHEISDIFNLQRVWDNLNN